MIGIRSAISIRARGHRPHLEAVYMTAPRSACRNTKKALAERGPSIHAGWLGLSGRDPGTGGKHGTGRISKHGGRRLRALLSRRVSSYLRDQTYGGVSY